MNRTRRLQNARGTKWIEEYKGKDLVGGYRRWYGIDALSAVIELQQLGVPGLEEREKKIRRDMELNEKAKSKTKHDAGGGAEAEPAAGDELEHDR